MGSLKHQIIQWNAALSIMGYWFLSALAGTIIGETTTLVSIAYRLFSVILSLLVIWICKQDILIEKNRSLLTFYAFILVAYTFRIVFDIAGGPFSTILPTSVFVKDLIYTVGGIFTPVISIITSRKYINISTITKIIYWTGLSTILLILYTQDYMDMSDTYEEERMDGGRGLGTLALVKIGAIELLSAIHMIMNGKHRYIYILGAALGIWLMLASGSRGGLVSVIIALIYFTLIYSKRNILFNIIVITSAIIVIVNIIPIIEWLGNYFPVVSQRMLMSILENDQSGRAELRAYAIDQITSHPFLGYSYRLGDSLTGYGCHNGILDIMLALGVPIGLLFIYFIYIKATIMASKMLPFKELFFPSVLSLFAVIHTITGNGITNNVFGTAICLMSITYYYLYPKYRSGNKMRK